jgi:probable phosphoglycerate mutase
MKSTALRASEPGGKVFGWLAERRGRSSRQQPASRIYLVRHGQTPLNAAGQLRGRLDPELDITGLQEAMNLADALCQSNVRLIVSSPLKRAADTAAPIVARCGAEIRVDERLIDRDYGRWAGRSKDELLAHWPVLDLAPEVEPSTDVLARAMKAFEDVAQVVQGGSAVIVTHDAVLQVLLPALDPHCANLDPVPQATGCYNLLQKQDDSWTVVDVNVKPQHRPVGGSRDRED